MLHLLNQRPNYLALVGAVFFLTLFQVNAAIYGRIDQPRAFPLGNDNQGGVTAPAGEFPNMPIVGSMPINPYTGNATRTVADLAVPAVGEIPLQWVRYNNTRVTGGSMSLGTEGNWRHSYQWDFAYTPAIVSVFIDPWVPPGSIHSNFFGRQRENHYRLSRRNN